MAFENVDFPREEKGEFGGNLIVRRFLQNSKTLLPNSVTVGGIIIFSIELIEMHCLRSFEPSYSQEI